MRNILEYIVLGIIIAIMILMITVIAMAFKFGVANEANRITQGIVVDKDYDPPSFHHFSGKNPTYQYIPEDYELCIEGQKDGNTVRYWFDVTPEEYAQYRIGDTYGQD